MALSSIATKVARGTSRRTSLEEEDVRQEVHMALVTAERAHDPGRGDWAPYAWTIARRAAAYAVRRHRAIGAAHRVDEDVLLDFPAPGTPEELLLQLEHLLLVRRRLDYLLSRHPRTDAAASSVLLGDETYEQAAARRGVKVASVYAAVRKMKKILSKDSVLLALWRNL